MRRLLVVPFVLAAVLGGTVPASAEHEICVGIKTRGTAIPNTETDFTCTVTTSPPLGWYCEVGYEGVQPDAWIEHSYCVPSV
jgi:hypothetical protein